MAHQDRPHLDRRWGLREREPWRDMRVREGRDENRDDNPLWGRHQPRQGGDFEDRYAGTGGSEARGDERSQRGQWRGETYGRGRYEHEDHLRSGGSYGGQYDEQGSAASEQRFYSPHEGANDENAQRRYGSGRDYEDRVYGYDPGREQEASQRSRYGRNADNEERYGQGYGSQAYRNSDRYGGDYSLAGAGLSGQWERGFGDMSRGGSGYYGGSDYGSRSSGYGEQSSWSGSVNRPARQSFRGKGPKGYERSDERLKELICERLMEDPDIDASEISVDVRNREVTLRGTVDDRRTKYEVEELIEQCGGVKDVKNELRVRARGSDSGDTTSSQAGSAQAGGSESSYGTSGLSGLNTGASGPSTGGRSK